MLVCHGPQHPVYPEISDLVSEGVIYVDPQAEEGPFSYRDFLLNRDDASDSPLLVNHFRCIYFVNGAFHLFFERNRASATSLDFPVKLGRTLFGNLDKLLLPGGVAILNTFHLAVHSLFESNLYEYLSHDYLGDYQEIIDYRTSFFAKERYDPSESHASIRRFVDGLLEPFPSLEVVEYPYYQLIKGEGLRFESQPLVIRKAAC
jgi:hypothetical protein